jgi:hypothetical protein
MNDMMTMSRALLADFERKAAMEERERIIKLIDSHFATCEKMTYECEVCSDRIELIEIIEGSVK